MDNWRSFHLFYAQPGHADLLVSAVAAGLRALTPEHDDWFFIRYAEGGAHVRIRVGERALPVYAQLREQARRECARLAEGADVSAWVRAISQPDRQGRVFAPGSVEDIAYVPETRRYGGPQALPENEQLFRVSTGIAARVIGLTGEDHAKRARLAVDLMLMTAAAVDCCGWPPGAFFSTYSFGWKNGLAAQTPDTPAGGVLAGASLAARLDVHRAFLASGRPADSLAAHWGLAVRAAHQAFLRLAEAGELISPIHARPPADEAELARAIAGMVYSQIHMMNNRLGFAPQAEILWSESLAEQLGGDARQSGFALEELVLSLGMRAAPAA